MRLVALIRGGACRRVAILSLRNGGARLHLKWRFLRLTVNAIQLEA